MSHEGAAAPEGICADIHDEASRLTDAARIAGLPLKLMGGVAVWLRSSSVREGPYARSYGDLDFCVAGGQDGRTKEFFVGHGYVPDQFFNALHGATRLYYGTVDGRWNIDVVVDQLTMSHRLDLRGRLGTQEPTLTLADLLLSKLQVWEVTHKDLGDALCLLADHPLGEERVVEGGTAPDDSQAAIGLDRIRSVLGADWGFCHTVERNLGKVLESWREEPLPSARFDVAAQVAALLAAIESAPKTLGWRARARVGERVRWYETPEEVRHQP